MMSKAESFKGRIENHISREYFISWLSSRILPVKYLYHFLPRSSRFCCPGRDDMEPPTYLLGEHLDEPIISQFVL